MPVPWPSSRSMAKWVLPVLVGPNTARTRAVSDDGEFAMARPSGRSVENARSLPPLRALRGHRFHPVNEPAAGGAGRGVGAPGGGHGQEHALRRHILKGEFQ